MIFLLILTTGKLIAIEPSREIRFYRDVGLLLEEVKPSDLEIVTNKKTIITHFEYNLPGSEDHIGHHLGSCKDETTRESLKTEILEKARQEIFSKFLDTFGVERENQNSDQTSKCTQLTGQPGFNHWIKINENNNLMTCALVPKEDAEKRSYPDAVNFCEKLRAQLPDPKNLGIKRMSNFMQVNKIDKSWVRHERHHQASGRKFVLTRNGNLKLEHKQDKYLFACVKTISTLKNKLNQIPPVMTTESPAEIALTTAPSGDSPTMDISGDFKMPDIDNEVQLNATRYILTSDSNLVKVDLHRDEPENLKLKCLPATLDSSGSDYAGKVKIFVAKSDVLVSKVYFELLNDRNLINYKFEAFLKYDLKIDNVSRKSYKSKCVVIPGPMTNTSVFFMFECSAQADNYKVENQIVTIVYKVNSLCRDVDFRQIGIFAETKNRKRRSVSLLSYYLHGAGLSPYSLNREIAKLSRIENLKLQEIRAEMFTSSQAQYLISDVSSLLTSTETNFCKLDDDLEISRLEERVRSEIDSTFTKLANDLNFCANGRIPASLPARTLNRLCVATNNLHTSCSDINTLRRLFSCTIGQYSLDKEYGSKIVISFKLEIDVLAPQDFSAFLCTSVPIPYHELKSDNLRNLPVKVAEKTKISTEKSQRDIRTMFKELLTEISRSKRSAGNNDFFTYSKILNIPEIILFRGKQASYANECKVSGFKVKCRYNSLNSQKTNIKCLKSIESNSTVQIHQNCEYSVFSDASCLVKVTHYNTFLLSTHQKVPIFVEIGEGINFNHASQNICEKDSVCHIFKRSAKFSCRSQDFAIRSKSNINIIERNIELHVDINALRPNFQNMNIARHNLNILYNRTENQKQILAKIEKNKILKPLLKFNDSHASNIKFYLALASIIILSILTTVAYFMIRRKITLYRMSKRLKTPSEKDKTGESQGLVEKVLNKYLNK